MLIYRKKSLIRRLLYSAFILLLPLFGSAASRPVVTLSDTNGVSATGQIMLYSPRRDLVKLRLDDGSRSFAVSALKPESLKTLERWRADENFESRSSLDISFRAVHSTSSSNVTGTVTYRRTRKETEETIGYEEKHFCKYKIRVSNDSDTPFETLIADYRIFFTQRLTEEYTGRYQLAGTETLPKLDARDFWAFSTAKFQCGISYREAPRIRWTGMPQASPPNIQGVLLRIRKKDFNGEWIEREIEHGEVPRNRDRSDYQKVYK